MFLKTSLASAFLAACLFAPPVVPAHAQATACEAELPADATAADYLDRAQACWALIGTPSRIEPEVVLRLTLESANSALALDPANAEAYALRGHVRLGTGALGQAIADLTLSLHLQPTANAYILRGLLMQTVDDFTGATADFNAAVALAPDDVDVLAARALYYFQREDWDAALADYEQIIALDPANADAYAYIGEIYDQAGRLDAALDAYEQHLALATNPSPAVNARVLILQSDSGE